MSPLDHLFAEDDALELALTSLSTTTDIRPLVLRTLLTYLELDSYLEAGTPFYADYRFKPLHSSEDILGRFEGERREFLKRLFQQAEKARSWLSVDVDQAARTLNTPRERIVAALDWLGEQQLLEVKAAGVRHRYRVLRRPDSMEALVVDLHQRVERRERAELGRLQQVLELAALDGCQTNALAAHFGEQLDAPCGHCGWCTQGATTLLPRAESHIAPELREQVQALRKQQETLAEPRCLTRFLCGVTSPHLSRAKLVGHPLFGRLDHVPFADVLRWMENA